MKRKKRLSPDDLPKSRTGRIPQWVMDEASGRRVETPGFRSYGVPDPLSDDSGGGERVRSRRRSWVRTTGKWAAVLTAVTGLGAVVFLAEPLNIVSTTGSNGTSANDPGWPEPGFGEEPEPLGSPPPQTSPKSDSFRFIATQVDGVSPVTWSPCRPIHYVYRETHAPKGGSKAIDRAISKVSAATGLRFVDDGATDEVPELGRSWYLPDLYGQRWSPVLIAWATPDEIPEFGVEFAGLASPITLDTPSGDATFVSGYVYLDPVKYDDVVRQSGRAVADTILLHELGHLIGLAHVNDAKQIMGPGDNTTEGMTDFQPGDLTGLRALGLGACQPDA